MSHAADGRCVVVFRQEKPSKVFGYEAYRKMQTHPLQHEPWRARASRAVLMA